MHDEQVLIPSPALAALAEARQRCARENTRLLVVAAGCEAWCDVAGLALLAHAELALAKHEANRQTANGQRTCLWLGDDLPARAVSSAVPLQHIHRLDAKRLLGDECSMAVINCHHGYSANTVAAISGMLSGGGLFIWLVPALSGWPGKPDPDFVHALPTGIADGSVTASESPFIQRVVKLLREQVGSNNNVLLIEQQHKLPSTTQSSTTQSSTTQPSTTQPPTTPPAPHNSAQPPLARPATAVAADTVPVQPTPAQQMVCDAGATLLQHTAGTVLVTAARGRGKSTALALVIANTLRDTDWDVVLVAPHRNNVKLLLRSLQAFAPGLPEGAIGRVSFKAADALLQHASSTAELAQPVLLVVDEAAGLALSLLERLHEIFPHKLIASTAQGYEGSGRGLILRFAERMESTFTNDGTLQRDSSSQAKTRREGSNTSNKKVATEKSGSVPPTSVYNQHIPLVEPIRWAAGDPVEKFIAALLCLADRPDDPASATVSPRLDEQTLNHAPRGGLSSRSGNQPVACISSEKIGIRKLVPADFLADEALLQHVFALLVEAHYQTQPNDLRLLLDAPYAHIWVAVEQNGSAQTAHVVAVLLALEEGGLDDTALLSAIVAGKRRPRGNLLAQRMANFSGEASWCREGSIRITRIAVAKNWRRRHVASQLLAAMKLWATAQGYSYWSSSFGFRSELLGFWQSTAAMPVYLGMHLDKSSGARNLMVAAALRPGAMQRFIAIAASDLYAYLDYWYPRFLVEFDASDKRALQQWSAGQQQPGPAPGVWALQRVKRFVAREIDVAAVVPALAVLQQADPAFSMLDASAAPPGSLAQLQNIIAQAPAWPRLARELELSGQAEVTAKLRDLCAALLPVTTASTRD